VRQDLAEEELQPIALRPRYATINGAKGLRLDRKTGSLTPGKEADILILDATKINVGSTRCPARWYR